MKQTLNQNKERSPIFSFDNILNTVPTGYKQARQKGVDRFKKGLDHEKRMEFLKPFSQIIVL